MQSQLFTISVMYYILSCRLVQGTPAEEALKKGELIYEEVLAWEIQVISLGKELQFQSSAFGLQESF